VGEERDGKVMQASAAGLRPKWFESRRYICCQELFVTNEIRVGFGRSLSGCTCLDRPKWADEAGRLWENGPKLNPATPKTKKHGRAAPKSSRSWRPRDRDPGLPDVDWPGGTQKG
jgi:hypothetical protein